MANTEDGKQTEQTTTDGLTSSSLSTDDRAACDVVDSAAKHQEDRSSTTADEHVKPAQPAVPSVTSPTCDDLIEQSKRADNRTSVASADDEVSDILQCADVVGDGVPEVEDVVVTEVIMSKTFTESIAPDREFVPIAGSHNEAPGGDVSPSNVFQSPTTNSNPSVPSNTQSTLGHPSSDSAVTVPDVSASTSADVANVVRETGEKSGVVEDTDVDSRRAVNMASGQARDLTDEFRRLQELLDNFSMPRRPGERPVDDDDDDDDGFSSSDENADSLLEKDDEGNVVSGGKRRVVYRYRIHAPPPLSTGRRWISRDRCGDDGNVLSTAADDTQLLLSEQQRTVQTDEDKTTTESVKEEAHSGDNKEASATTI